MGIFHDQPCMRGYSLIFVTLILTFRCANGAPIGSKTYIIHTVKNATHVDDVTAKHAWYTELMRGAKAILADDHPDDGMDSLHHVYHHVINGFSARLTPEQASYMATLPSVIRLFPDTFRRVQTTHTPAFLGLTTSGARLWPESKWGDDVIVGVIDSGIWPRHKSFSDLALGPVPAKWKGGCDSGPGFNASVDCNLKIIGARYFIKGYEAIAGRLNDTMDLMSPVDVNGHGTHCASTAAGRVTDGAGFAAANNAANGTARGMAPRARIAVYKVMWGGDGDGADSDILQGFDQAVADGVDVISASIGPSLDLATGAIPELVDDHYAIASYNAAKKGVFVSLAGGNDGPMAATITHVAPWMTTVGASTTDRDIVASVVLGNGEVLPGRSIYDGKGSPIKDNQTAIIFAGDAAISSSLAQNASFCQSGSLNASLVTGKILLCNSDGKAFPQTTAGAAALIVANTEAAGESLTLVPEVPIWIGFGNQARKRMMAYIRNVTASSPTASIRGATTVYGATPAPMVAGLSSRGPIHHPQGFSHLQWLKPDVVAPGVDILAAGTGIHGPEYAFMSGTSMACPHISGIGALLRSAHPTWSPAAIKSALMTTATTKDNTNKTITAQELTTVAATPWAFGAGHVQPEKAMNPGLVYDMGPNDYLLFLCALGYDYMQIRIFDFDGFVCPSDLAPRVEDANMPSFVANFVNPAALSSPITFNRSLTNVAPTGSTYTASIDVQQLERFDVTVAPSTLTFATGASVLNFVLTVAPRADANFTDILPGAAPWSEFSIVSWSDDVHVVQSPVVVMLYG